MRQEVPIVGGYGKDVDLHLSAEDTLNWLPVRSESPGARSQFMLRQAPGLRPLTQIGTGPIRGLHTVEGRLYAVSGTQLYEVTNSYVGIPRGTIPGVGRVSMAHNQRGTGNELAVDNGSARYVLNTATLAFQKVTDAGFPGSFIAFYVDQYLGYVEPQGRYWGHSDLADALSYNTLDQYEAEGDPDRIVSAYVSHREVLIFGKETIEPFVNTGGSTGTFERASNTVIENGCSSRYGVAGMDNSVFWPDDKRILRRLEGYTAVRFSTAAEEALLAECTDSEIKRAYAFTWEDKGHKVYYLTVPGKFTLGYDLLSGQFHRRSSPGLNTWRINSLAFWNGVWVGGDMQSGSLYALDWNYHFDGQEELVRERVTGALTKEQARLLVSEIELVFGTGGPASVAVDFSGQPTAPTISGNAPSGSVGDAYSYAYTVGGGTAPLTVALSPGSGPLPPGLTLSSAGVLSGTPTTVGSYSWEVRVTDANGLYDDLADTASIGIASVKLATTRIGYTGFASALAAGSTLGATGSADNVRISPNGMYCAISDMGTAGGDYFKIAKFDTGTDTWSILPNPGTMPGSGPTGMIWADDSTLIIALDTALTNDFDVWVYTRSGDTFTRVSAYTDGALAAPDVYGIALASDGSKLAVSEANTGNTFNVFDFDGTTLTAKRGEAGAGGLANGIRLAFRADAVTGFVAAANGVSLEMYSDNGTALTLVDTLAVSGNAGLYWYGEYLYCVGFDSVPVYTINVVRFSAGNLTLESSITLPAAAADSSITPNGQYIALSGATVPVYEVTPGTPPTIALDYTAPTAGGPVASVTWSAINE